MDSCHCMQVYFSVSTASTVGYGDISPTHTLTKIFTCVYTPFAVVGPAPSPLSPATSLLSLSRPFYFTIVAPPSRTPGFQTVTFPGSLGTPSIHLHKCHGLETGTMGGLRPRDG